MGAIEALDIGGHTTPNPPQRELPTHWGSEGMEHRLPGDVYDSDGKPITHISTPGDASRPMPGTPEYVPTSPSTVRLPCGSGT